MGGLGGRMTPEELNLIETRLKIFMFAKTILKDDYERLKRASANGDVEAEKLANKILEAFKSYGLPEDH